MRGEGVEKFGPNSGRFVSWLSIVAATAVAVVTLADGWHDVDPVVLAAMAVVVLLVWAILLRPALYTDGDELELRNPFQSIFIPLASVEAVSSRLVFVVMTYDDVFRSAAVTTKRRALLMQGRGQRSGDDSDGVPGKGSFHDPNRGLNSQGTFAADSGAEYGQIVEDRLTHLAEDARARGLSRDDEVRRELAWPIIAALAALTVLAVVFGVL